jgi:cobalamin biosynthesis protein CbiD
MSEIELKKQKAFQLIQEVDDENIIEEVVKFLQEKKHTLTAEQIFSKISSRYDNTLRKLAQ